jgi:hypothetical protein
MRLPAPQPDSAETLQEFFSVSNPLRDGIGTGVEAMI